jgi:hypothetical protein
VRGQPPVWGKALGHSSLLPSVGGHQSDLLHQGLPRWQAVHPAPSHACRRLRIVCRAAAAPS